MITIFTPTFNRKEKLKRLYQSICRQTFSDYEWLVIDDGSSDGTEKYISEIKRENDRIRYYKQNNSGKHVAFNNGIEKAKGDIFICVDSDDCLTADALKKIQEIHKKYSNNSSICGYVFQKGTDINKPLYKHYKEKEFIENYNKYIINGGFKGDKCEVFITRILKKYRFPIFDNEKFLSEGFLWSRIGKKYNYVFIDDIIYLCEYLENGLTKQGKKLRINNPLGGMNHAAEFLNKDFNYKVRIKNSILYLVYGQFAKIKLKELIKKSNDKALLVICIIPSMLLKRIWEIKY